MGRRRRRRGSRGPAAWLALGLAGWAAFLLHTLVSWTRDYGVDWGRVWEYGGLAGRFATLALEALVVALCCAVLLSLMWRRWRGRRMRRLVRGSAVLTAEGFLSARVPGAHGPAGVYVLRNVTRDRCYVGQAHDLPSRVAQHLGGHGNGDVYADYRYGDDFTVQLIPLAGSGYRTLDALERDTIAAYDAYGHGYNRTRGNGVG